MIYLATPSTQVKKRVVYYLRVSSLEQTRGGSVATQARLFDDWRDEVNSDTNSKDRWIYVDRYTEAASASEGERRVFQKMMADAAKDKFDLIVVFDPERFARDHPVAMNSARDLKKLNVELRFWTLRSTDLATAEGELVFRQQSLYADYFSKKLGGRVKLAMDAKRERKEWVGRAPYGWRVLTSPSEDGSRLKKTQLAKHPIEWPVVERIFQLSKDGRNLSEIAQLLVSDPSTRNKTRTLVAEAERKAMKQELTGRTSKWSRSQVRSILNYPKNREELL